MLIPLFYCSTDGQQASISQAYKKCKALHVLQCVQKVQAHEYSYKIAGAEVATEKQTKGWALFSVFYNFAKLQFSEI